MITYKVLGEENIAPPSVYLYKTPKGAYVVTIAIMYDTVCWNGLRSSYLVCIESSRVWQSSVIEEAYLVLRAVGGVRITRGSRNPFHVPSSENV